MSRIGKLPVQIPRGVSVDVQGNSVTVKGPLGTLVRSFDSSITVQLSGESELLVKRLSDAAKCRGLHGLSRVLLNNMVVGVSEGFKKDLIIEGVGYKVEKLATGLLFSLGYSHPIMVHLPKGVVAEVGERKVTLALKGPDKEVVGQLAAKIRGLRAPEPYKGKGVRYSTEVILRKEGKSGAKK